MKQERRVSLVLCDGAGSGLLGMLPTFTVHDPWWQEVKPVIEGARERFGADVIVLRILDVTSDGDRGGDVTYLAELTAEPAGELPLTEVEVEVEPDDPFRASWARPGGVRATIAWADEALAAIGRPRVGRAAQIKTWNLSSVLQLPTADGLVWCKTVPPFLVDEGSIIALVGAEEPTLVPPVLGSDAATRTVLLDDVAGEDQWNAPEELLGAMVEGLVRLQSRLADRVDDLLAAGLADWRGQPLVRLVEALVERADVRAQLRGEELRTLDALVASLPVRAASLDACGIPETLVHGDFHPGNWRWDGRSLVLLDWGDTGVGHPMFDMSSFQQYVPDEARARIRARWIDAWRGERPGSDPARAEVLAAPVSALRRAVIYQGFLDRIEASERRYHETDVRSWLLAALDEAAAGGRGGS
jgi:hypothetical protein